MLDINASDTDVQLVFKHIECGENGVKFVLLFDQNYSVVLGHTAANEWKRLRDVRL